jgi:hypothetical protein
MSEQKKDTEGMGELAAQYDAWLRSNNVITTLTHNTIVLNLYVQFPIKYVEYLMDPDNEELDLTVYLGFWRALFTNKKRMMDKMFAMFSEYLPNYKVTLRVALYRSNLERKVSNGKATRSKLRSDVDSDDLVELQQNFDRKTFTRDDFLSKSEGIGSSSNSGSDLISSASLSKGTSEGDSDS